MPNLLFNPVSKSAVRFISPMFFFIALALPQPSVSEPLKPAVMLAQSWKPSMDVEGWLMSEKLDGVRGYWTGTKMLSRSGHVYSIPEWFVESLPPFPLDGELWTARKEFFELSGIVRKKSPSKEWKKVKYCIFDVPDAKGGFEDRLEIIKRWIQNNPSPHITVIEQKICSGKNALLEELARVESKGGEGLMLRRPGSEYTQGRSMDLLKVKSFHDAEAVVLAHIPGKGKYSGKMGSLLVEMPNKVSFYLGTGFSDKERTSPPPVGSTVTFKYKEYNKSGVPRFASFLRIRKPDTGN